MIEVLEKLDAADDMQNTTNIGLTINKYFLFTNTITIKMDKPVHTQD